MQPLKIMAASVKIKDLDYQGNTNSDGFFLES